MDFTFKKEERLCSRRLIDQLYAEGHRLMAFPFSVQWLAFPTPPKEQSSLHSLALLSTPLHSPCQVLIVAPKRKFKHAVDRNTFLEEHGISIVFSMVYIHNEILTFEQLGKKMDKLMEALEKDILSNCEL